MNLIPKPLIIGSWDVGAWRSAGHAHVFVVALAVLVDPYLPFETVPFPTQAL